MAVAAVRVSSAKNRADASPAAPYNWSSAIAAMHETLEASVATSDSPEEAVKRAIRDREHSVFIVNGRLYCDRAFLGEMKHELHLRFMRSVMRRARKVAKANGLDHDALLAQRARAFTAYAYDSGASGPSDCNPHLPTLVIAKKKGTDQCGTMVPNPYFDDLGAWDEETKRLLEVAAKKPWHERNPRVFWRGKIRGRSHDDDCARDAGNFARIAACSLTLRYPRHFDVRATSCQPRNPRDCPVFKIDNFERHALAVGCRAVLGQFEPHGKFADYRYLLDLPGSTTGSYSRNLNHLWFLGAIVLAWTGALLDEPAAQWYTPALAPGVTHLVLRPDAAAEAALRDVKKSEKLRDSLLANARGVADNLLCADCIVDYVLRVFAAIDAKSPNLRAFLRIKREGDHLDRRRRQVLRDANCNKLRLVQVVGHHPTHHHRGRRPPEPWRVATHPVKSISACELLARGGRTNATSSRPS